MEIVFPKRVECKSLLVLFGSSLTSMAHSGYRVEFPFMQVGMSTAYISKQYIDSSLAAIQDVSYSTQRPAILAAGYPVPAPLAQVN